MTEMKIDPLELTKSLIKCQSVTPEDGGAQKVLSETLKGLGFECNELVFEDSESPKVKNLYARIGNAAPNFCFAGHTDVVPVGDIKLWESEPFDAIERNGFLFGRGASDMKSAIACFVSAASQFIEKYKSDLGGSVSLLITGDEEGPAINGTKKLLKWISDKNETLDACLVGEPTNPNNLGDMIKIGRRGSVNGKLVVFGTQGHTAYPHLADNPIHRITKIISAIIDSNLDNGNEHFQPSTLQFSSVDVGNSTTNVIPSEATANFNIRFNDNHNLKSLEEWLKNTIRNTGGIDPDQFELSLRLSGDAFITPPGELSNIISDSVEQVTSRIPDLSTTGGTSDARFIKDYCPVAEFGMVGKSMHKTNECVKISDLEQLTLIYFLVLERFFKKI